MTLKTVTTRATAASMLTTLLVGVIAVGLPMIVDGSPAFAQETGSEVDPEAAKAAEREQAKQQRIEEYLRKREERRARQTQERLEKETAKAQKAEVAAAASTTAPVGEAPPDAELAEGEDLGEVYIPENIAAIHAALRTGPLGRDPTVVNYMELIERADASPYQLAAFGNFLAQNGMTRDAIQYYALALSLEQEDPVLWLNVGTLHRQLGEYSAAVDTYERSLALDPNNGYAHYNLASVLDTTGQYDRAIAEYRAALLLDPNLGDPTVNPQAANNERMLAVKLMIYREQEGSVGLPLLDVPGGSVESNTP